MDQEIRYTKQGRPWPPPLSGGFWRNVRLASLALLLLLLALSTYFFLQAPAVMATKLTAEGEVAVYGSRCEFPFVASRLPGGVRGHGKDAPAPGCGKFWPHVDY